MDQLRTALAWLKKQHFWVLSGLVVLIPLLCWWSAAGKMSKKYDENQKRITGEFSSIQQLRSDPFHPNSKIREQQELERQKQAKAVFAVWQELYDRQTEEVLEWPPSLSPEFLEYVKNLQFGEDIPQRLRNNYRDYADRHFPSLPAIVGARPLREGEAGSSGRGEFTPRGGPRGYGEGGPGLGFGTSGQTEEDDGNYICEWLDQHVVREELDFPQRPYSMRIWVTQEDLWVYKALLLSIRNVNEAAGATRMSNAAIRTIYSLEVGQRAAGYSRTPDRIYDVPTAAPAGGAEMLGEFPGGEPGAEPGAAPTDRGMPGRMDFGAIRGGGEAMSESEEKAMLLAFRYLDENGKPIPVGNIGMAVDPEMPAPDTSAADVTIDPAMFGKEYKRLPVRMVLEMDQRHLPHLIAQCASQSLQVEVQEVRINPADVGGSSGGGPEGYRPSFGGGFGGGLGSSNLFPDRTGLLEFNPQPHIVNVVIQGVIYIFNKPEPSMVEPAEDAQMASAN
jgi:hypothetical protein